VGHSCNMTPARDFDSRPLAETTATRNQLRRTPQGFSSSSSSGRTVKPEAVSRGCSRQPSEKPVGLARSQCRPRRDVHDRRMERLSHPRQEPPSKRSVQGNVQYHRSHFSSRSAATSRIKRRANWLARTREEIVHDPVNSAGMLLFPFVIIPGRRVIYGIIRKTAAARRRQTR